MRCVYLNFSPCKRCTFTGMGNSVCYALSRCVWNGYFSQYSIMVSLTQGMKTCACKGSESGGHNIA